MLVFQKIFTYVLNEWSLKINFKLFVLLVAQVNQVSKELMRKAVEEALQSSLNLIILTLQRHKI